MECIFYCVLPLESLEKNEKCILSLPQSFWAVPLNTSMVPKSPPTPPHAIAGFGRRWHWAPGRRSQRRCPRGLAQGKALVHGSVPHLYKAYIYIYIIYIYMYLFYLFYLFLWGGGEAYEAFLFFFGWGEGGGWGERSMSQ